MKTKELIRQLQEMDPTGEEDVTVGNVDIHFVGREPSYWDGCKQVLIRDEECEYYNIIGAKVVSDGDKIVIETLSIRNAIWNDPDIPIEYDEYSERHYKESYEEERAKVKKFEEERK